MEKNCGKDVKRSLIPYLKRCWASWNQQIEECGLMMNDRLPQKTKTKKMQQGYGTRSLIEEYKEKRRKEKKIHKRKKKNG